MDYRKEKNLLIASANGVVKGQYDWVSQTFYGVKGTPIKAMPAAFKGTVYGVMISMHSQIMKETSPAIRAMALERWERLISLELYANDIDIFTDPHFEFPSLKKDYVHFIIAHCERKLTRHTDTKYLCTTIPEYNLLHDQFRTEINSGIFYNRYYHQHDRLVWDIKALFRLQVEDYEYLSDSSRFIVNKYYDTCMAMKQEPIITKNFIVTICKTLHMYDIWRTEHLDECLQKFNDKKELYYENDTYVMYPLTTAAMFHDEASQQSNCVERLYMERVANGQTHVVAIRKKQAPTQALITCEINKDWKIIQYLARFNSQPTRSEDNFKKELTSYLNSLSKK